MNKAFKIIAVLEGISYIVLFFNMLVIKKIANDLYHNLLFPIGLAHGLLFVFYVLLAVMLKIENQWSMKRFLLVILASLLPFGTFYAEKKGLYK